MIITLHNGMTYDAASNSTLTEMIIFVDDITEFVEVYNTMTDENLSEYSVGDQTAVNRTLMETKTYKAGARMEAHFIVLPTETQLIIEELEARALVNADKAQAYDILVGEEVI